MSSSSCGVELHPKGWEVFWEERGCFRTRGTAALGLHQAKAAAWTGNDFNRSSKEHPEKLKVECLWRRQQSLLSELIQAH